MGKTVMFIAGEASGDLHGSGVIRELKKALPDIQIFGVGGDLMAKEGMQLVYHIREISIVGFVEVIKHLPLLLSVRRTLKELLRRRKPDVVCLIDYPGFNLRFAKIAKQFGIKVVYYIAPQVWAWKKSRLDLMKRVVDSVCVILPFEVSLYKEKEIDVQFVGHPLLEEITTNFNRKNFCKRYGIDEKKKILAILPGSRRQEIDVIFPEVLEASRKIASEKDLEIIVGIAPDFDEKYFTTFFDVEGIHLIKGETYDVIQHSEFAIVASGTATLETALLGTPMIIVYKAAWLTYLIAKMLIRIKHIGLVNIIAGKEIVPELLQNEMKAELIANKVLEFLDDPNKLEIMRRNLANIKTQLGTKGTSKLVAERLIAV